MLTKTNTDTDNYECFVNNKVLVLIFMLFASNVHANEWSGNINMFLG